MTAFLDRIHDFFGTMAWPLAGLLLLAAVLDLALSSKARPAWLGVPGVLLLSVGAPWWLGVGSLAFAVVLVVPQLRRPLLTKPVLGLLKALRFLPSISETERVAIEAGNVWLEGELFSGRPDFTKLLEAPVPTLSEAEQAFLDGPVNEVCRMCEDWDVQQERDLSPETWQYLKDEGFFGMIIPEKYSGLGFSSSANSAVIAKLASRCQTLAITVMVPNSLGPAELLLHHGTEAQKDHYLPRLARGEEMPAFALTEPGAGSDAGSLSASGVVFKNAEGELSLRLNWEKRYITLASISTVLGLAFRLKDPEGLLGGEDDLGITCALIPTETPGVDVSRRHDPLGIPFYNCPTVGTDVEVPFDAIIGGKEGAGQGWRMLMESLAAGRGISLPAACTGGVKLVARVAGAHAKVRKQFGLPIGKFEGIEEPLARIGGTTWLLEATRRYTNGGLDGGAKPAVTTAIAKYNFTELFREAMNDAMDVLGGNAISRGPANLLATPYTGTPIMITVEGANILTRTLIIFGQGAIRCHPFAYAELTSAAKGDLVAFDTAFWGHVVHVFRNGARAAVLSVSRGLLAVSPVKGPSASYVRRLAWASASFAFLADVAMGLLGGDLKRKEKITGRFADIFSWLYLATAAVRRFEAEGRQAEHLPFLRYSMETAFARMQVAFDGILSNLGGPVLRLAFWPVALWSRLNSLGRGPSDALGARVAQAMQTPGELRDALTEGIYQPAEPTQALAQLDRALLLCTEADVHLRAVKNAMGKGKIPKGNPEEALEAAMQLGVIDAEKVALVKEAAEARRAVIRVDSFELEDYMRSALRPEASVSQSA